MTATTATWGDYSGLAPRRASAGYEKVFSKLNTKDGTCGQNSHYLNMLTILHFCLCHLILLLFCLIFVHFHLILWGVTNEAVNITRDYFYILIYITFYITFHICRPHWPWQRWHGHNLQPSRVDIRARNEPSRRLKFQNHGEGHLPWVNARLELCLKCVKVLVEALSVIVKLQSSRRLVSSSSGDVGRCRAHRSRAKMWVHPITLMYASTQRRRGDARRGWAGLGPSRCVVLWPKEIFDTKKSPQTTLSIKLVLVSEQIRKLYRISCYINFKYIWYIMTS